MDKQGKNTGPGKVSERVVGKGGGVDGIIVAANLFNYNFDGNLLKEEHRRYLDERIISFLRRHPLHVKLHGTASRIGNADYNRQLSQERVLRVKQYLLSRGLSESQVPGTQMTATGEDLVPAEHAPDDERDRAVRLLLALGRKALPIPPHIALPPVEITPGTVDIALPPVEISVPPRVVPPTFKRIPINVSRIWKIQLLGAGDLSIPIPKVVSVGANQMFFELSDLENKQKVTCVLVAGTVGGPGGPGSVTTSGKGKVFSTRNPQRITDFSGRASWNSLLSAGDVGWGSLTIAGVPQGKAGSPTSALALEVQVPTGTTFGASTISTSQGHLSCTEPVPF